MKIDERIQALLIYLDEQGYETYLVGGAVRDALLNYPIHDYDILTKAPFAVVQSFFPNDCWVSFRKGNTVRLACATLSLDVCFLEEDLIAHLKKRDFTINTILYHPTKGYIDWLGGRMDLVNQQIRPADTAEVVLDRDPIRILRAIRFQAELNFSLDPVLKEVLFLKKDRLLTVSKERIQQELNRILLSEKPSGVLKEFLPVFATFLPPLDQTLDFPQENPYHSYSVLDHILKVVDATPPQLVLRLAALFHDIEKPACYSKDEKGIAHFYGHDRLSSQTAFCRLTDLRYPKRIISSVVRLIAYHDDRPASDDLSLRTFLYRFGTKDLDLLFLLKKADIIGQNPALQYRLCSLVEIHRRLRHFIETKQYVTKKDLAIKGEDLLRLGFCGKAIGQLLEELRKKVCLNELSNQKEVLWQEAKTYKKADVRFG